MSLGKGWGFALSRVKCSSSSHHQAQAHLVTSTSTSSRPKHAMPPLSRFLLPFKYAKERYAGHPLRLSIAALKTIFVFHVFWQYGYSIAPLAGPSMLPTFEVAGDSVIVSRYYRRGRGVKVGDVVSFDSVVEPGESVLKRVLGLQGDYVLRDTPGTTDLMVQVPEGHCWVVGDNLPWSRDSRHFGPMPMALIKGKVIAKVLPWSERRWIEDGLQSVDHA